jgi:O-antigen/teichoic acid export membrane protein
MGRSILVLLGYGVFAQIITFSISPILTRIYSPESFGIYSTLMLISAFLMPIMTLSMPMAIVLEKSHTSHRYIANLSLRIVVIISLLFLPLCPILAFLLPKLDVYTCFLAIVLTSMLSFNEIVSYSMLKNNDIAGRGRLVLFQALFSASLKVVFGLVLASSFSMILSVVIGFIISFFLYRERYKDLMSFKNKSFWVLFNGKRDYIYLSKYRSLVTYRTFQNVISGLNQLLPILFLNYYFGSAVAGCFGLTRTVLTLPLNVLGKSLQDVMFPRYTKRISDEYSIYKEILISILIVLGLSVLPILILMSYGEELFSLVFGEDWIKSGEYSAWLIIPILFSLANRSLVVVATVFKMEKKLFFNSLIMTLILILTYGFLPRFINSDLTCVIWGSTFSIVPQLLISLFCFNKLYIYEKKISSTRCL